MKFILSFLCVSLMFMGCQPAPDNSANEAFEKNSQTVLSLLEAFQAESLDYAAFYSDSLVVQTTGYADPRESMNLDDIKAANAGLWATYDLKLITDPVVLLPGVNADTRMADGSVRYYGAWEVTLTATDSTAAKSGVIRLYASYDFDADGKVNNQQSYGDFTGLMSHLNAKDVEAAEEAAEE